MLYVVLFFDIIIKEALNKLTFDFLTLFLNVLKYVYCVLVFSSSDFILFFQVVVL